jgi:ribosomal protein S18 acetylase RimI-like enzyme
VSAVIRPFVSLDRASLEETIDVVCAEGRWMSTPHLQPTPAWVHALEKTACPSHLLLVAEDARHIAGWCRLFPSSECNGHVNAAELGIGLLPEYRGRGLGRAFVNHALNWAAAAGIEHITLITRADNSRALRLFRRFAFTVTNESADGRVEMVCHLSASEE